MAKVLLIGSGGREHAIAHALSKSEKVKDIIVSPGNGGTETLDKVTNKNIDLKDIVNVCKSEEISLVVVGPEDPLANGLADDLNQNQIPVFGPTKLASEIEWNKVWAKDFMIRHDIPTAEYKSFSTADEAKEFINGKDWTQFVVKYAGLAAGKGVIVATSKTEAINAVDEISSKFIKDSDQIIIEECLAGEEFSALCFTDGTSIAAMPPAQDHKRLLENDKGPNTGGMGAYTPYRNTLGDDTLKALNNILIKAVDGLKKEGRPFVGTLYAGVMLTQDGPKVLEFNCRFGDPETQVILPLLQSDIFEIMMACAEGKLADVKVKFDLDSYCVGICLVSLGYPGTYEKGKIINGLDEKFPANVEIYHAGTKISGNTTVTSGGRVLAVVAKEATIHEALKTALQYVDAISFDGKAYRRDIASRAIFRQALNSQKITYKSAGVDIESGNTFVENIKPLVKSTHIDGVLGHIGGFGGLFDISMKGFKNPVLVTGADGVGTKLLVCQECKNHSTVGEDLVAMCVNDILMHGATPLYFLDYLATGKLCIGDAEKIITGVVSGCQKSKCALLGGETAEMPGLYASGHYDLAGFAVGVVEKEDILPKTNDMDEGDLILAVPSSGFHSNGFSLVRKILKDAEFSYSEPSPFNSELTIGDELLTPTRIYVKDILAALQSKLVLGAAHITGGGLVENIPRILPPHLSAHLDSNSWKIPNIFNWIGLYGVPVTEMVKTFNLGIGVVMIIKKENLEKIQQLLTCDDAFIIGSLKKSNDCKQRVIIEGIEEKINFGRTEIVEKYPKCLKTKPKKNVAVLISGSGTNLQALIDHTLSTNSSANIKLVISNIHHVKGLARAKSANIKAMVISHKNYPIREAFEDAIHSQLVENSIDIICLAGFMRILTPKFVNAWRGKMLNIHPSLLPSFKGINAQRQALEAKVKITGCTVHFVSEEVDCGGIIVQEAVEVKNDKLEELVEDIKKAEHIAFPRAMELLAREKVTLMDNGTVRFS